MRIKVKCEMSKYSNPKVSCTMVQEMSTFILSVTFKPFRPSNSLCCKT